MSKLPIISAHNTEGLKPTYTQRNPYQNQNHSLTTNDSLPPNGMTLNDFPPIHQQINPVIYETKLNEFQSKLSALEEANAILLSRLNTNERNFELQLKELQYHNQEERDNAIKNQKLISMVTDQQNLSSNDLKLKINLIQEVMQKDESWKVQQRERDIEMYKSLINKLTEKVSETVKMEVEARFKADMDNKAYTQSLTNRFENEVDIIRKEMEDIMNQTRWDWANMSKECSERTHNVSKYIDQQISEAVFGKGTTNDNLKNFVHKLTEQIKTNWISQNTQNEMADKRLTKIEEYLTTVKDDTYKFIATVEERWINKMKDLKWFTEINIRKNNENNYAMLQELSTNIDTNIQFLTNQIIDTRIKTNINFEQTAKQNTERFKSLCEDMSAVCNRIYLYEDLLKQFDKTNTEIKTQITKDLTNMQSMLEINNVNERILHSIENENLQEQINRISMTLMAANNNFSDNMMEINKSAQSNFGNWIERINYLQEMITTVSEKNYQMFEEFQKNSDKIEIKQIMNEMIFKTENENIIEQLQKSRDIEYDHILSIHEHTLNLTTAINGINSNKISINDIQYKIDLINSALNASGDNANGMTRQMELMKERMKENERIEGVNLVMEMIWNNVESIMNREQVMQLGNSSEALILNSISNIEKKFTAHLASNENDFKEIYSKWGKSDTSEIEIKCTLQQMLTNVEFNNIYNILRTGLPASSSPVMNISAGDVQGLTDDKVDSKLNNIYEKWRNDNINMWVNAVELTQKVNQPGEIRKIIQEIPPVVIPMSETLKRIMDVDYDSNKYPKPVVPQLNSQLKNMENNEEAKNQNNQPEVKRDKKSRENTPSAKKTPRGTPNYENNAPKSNQKTPSEDKTKDDKKEEPKKVEERKKSQQPSQNSQGRQSSKDKKSENKSQLSKTPSQSVENSKESRRESGNKSSGRNKSESEKKSVDNIEDESLSQSESNEDLTGNLKRNPNNSNKNTTSLRNK